MLNTLLTDLKCYGALANLEHAIANFQDRIAFTGSLLEAELASRKKQTIKRRISQAGFPRIKEWTDIDYAYNPKIAFSAMEPLLNGDFVRQHKNICFIGRPGTGKTHCLIAIGRELCRKGFSVRFITASDLVLKLEDCKINNSLPAFMQKIAKPQLLIIDELGFVPFSDNGARLLFEIFAKRYERGSIGISTNLMFDKWTQLFGSVELTAALLDRFTQGAVIIPFDGETVRPIVGESTIRNLND
ncbi:MAG: IS21-like element helper ATPase IstB [bacterium]